MKPRPRPTGPTHETPFAEFDFSDCRNPKAAVAEFLKEVGSTILEGEDDGAVEVYAFPEEDAPGRVTVFITACRNASTDLWDGASTIVSAAEREARRIGNAQRDRPPPSPHKRRKGGAGKR